MNFIKIIRERKIINGSLYRRYFIDSKGNPVGIPIGITTCKMGGQNYVTNRNLKSLGDVGSCALPYSDAATQEAAILKVIKINETVTHNTTPTAPRADKRKKTARVDFFCDFDNSKLPTGVNIQHVDGLKQVIITVSYFDECKNKFCSKSIYVGTANTWKERYPQKLQEAIKLREESLKIYNKLTSQNQNAETTAA